MLLVVKTLFDAHKIIYLLEGVAYTFNKGRNAFQTMQSLKKTETGRTLPIEYAAVLILEMDNSSGRRQMSHLAYLMVTKI